MNGLRRWWQQVGRVWRGRLLRLPIPRRNRAAAVPHAEQVLRESEERYRQLAQLSPDAIVVHREGQIIFVNAAGVRLLGAASEQELLGRSVMDFIHPDDAPMIRERMQQVMEERRPTDFAEQRLVRLDGQIIHAEAASVAVPLGGKVIVQTVARDITERREAERQRLALEIERERVRVLEKFIGDASHDLRTPLTTIRFSVYLLGKLADTERQRHYLSILESQFLHLEGLLESMLNLSRLDRETAFEMVPVDVMALTQDIVARQAALAERKGQDLRLTGEPHLPAVMADREHLTSAISNVIVNAIHYTPAEGTITVRVYREGRQVVVAV